MQYLKIGYARQFPEDRIAKHACKMRQRMLTLGIRRGNTDSEAALVRDLRKLTARKHGTREWFYVTPLVLTFIVIVLAASD